VAAVTCLECAGRKWKYGPGTIIPDHPFQALTSARTVRSALVASGRTAGYDYPLPSRIPSVNISTHGSECAGRKWKDCAGYDYPLPSIPSVNISTHGSECAGRKWKNYRVRLSPAIQFQALTSASTAIQSAPVANGRISGYDYPPPSKFQALTSASTVVRSAPVANGRTPGYNYPPPFSSKR
jgi:hypothetical protein